MYISLYRKYRPQTFSDMVGQNAAVCVLQESIKENRLGHAYLFSGPRGCGKTSAARLVAKSLNCLSPSDGCEPCGKCQNCISIANGEHLDVIEIDGASNRGIGEIRDLKTHVNLKPLSSAYKVYIIDEVHMLTEAAFNALLKTIEEPPENVIFILATTEPHKVPVTIRSRCQHIPFHRISISDTVARINYVCENENISYEEEAVWELARQSDGALRDALSLTEQAVALGRGALTVDGINELTGGCNRAEIERWISVLSTDQGEAVSRLRSLLAGGMSPERFCEALFSVFKDLWIYCAWGDKTVDALEISETERAFLKTEAAHWDTDKLRRVCLFCNSIMPRARYGMKTDVFAGLIMLGLTDIIHGITQHRGPATHVNPKPLVSVEERSRPPFTQPRTVAFAAAPTVRTNDTGMQGADTPSVPGSFDTASSGIDIESLCRDIGSGAYSSVIAKLSSRQLIIASALLSASIVSNGEDNWNLAYESDSLSKATMSAVRNRGILEKAVSAVWNIKIDRTAQPEPADEHDDPSAAAEALPEQGAAQTKSETATPLDSSSARILKLMGAEVLYVHDDTETDDSSMDGGEHNG